MYFYLLNLTVSGIKNIDKDVRLDFYKKTVNKDFNPDKYRVKAIYGENGSGKSAIITSVMILREIVLNRKYLSDSKNQKFLSEIVNKVSHHFSMTVEFYSDVNKKIYRYQFALALMDDDSYAIDCESLSCRSGSYSNSRWSDIYKVNAGVLTVCNVSNDTKNIINLYTMNLLQNASLMSIMLINGTKVKVDSKNADYISFTLDLLMAMAMVTVLNVYMDEADQHKKYISRAIANELKELGKDVKMPEFPEDYESIGSKNIKKTAFSEYQKRVEKLTKFIRIFKPDLSDIVIDRKDNGDNYVCELNLKYNSYMVNLEFESTGIKKLVRLFDCFKAASNGAIVFIDELDSNINDVFLCRLIEYFVHYGEGQLCFTTHNLDPMSVLDDNSNAIDFLSSYGTITSWVKHGHASPINTYKNGMIQDMPFNIDAADFLAIFGED